MIRRRDASVGKIAADATKPLPPLARLPIDATAASKRPAALLSPPGIDCPNERQPAALLLRLEEAAQCGIPLPSEVAFYVRESLARWKAGEPLEKAFGVARRPGQRSRKTVADLAISDRAIRELRRQYFADLGITAAAREIARAGRQYEASAWRHDRRNPSDIADSRRQLMAEALQHRPSFPRQRRIVDILRNEPVDFHCTTDSGCFVLGPKAV